MEKTPDYQSANQTDKASTQKTVTPSQCTYNRGYDNESHCLTDVVTRTPKAVKRTTFLVRKPTGQADHTRSSTHRLKPSADTPKNGKQNKRMYKSQTEVHQSSHQQTGRHKTIDIATVSKKTVHKLTYSIGKEQHSTDNAQFCFRENALIYNRFLYDIQAQTTNIIHAITKCSSKKSRPLKTFQTLFLFGQRFFITGFRL